VIVEINVVNRDKQLYTL